MAYFPNGTAGECYFEEYCSKCIHMPINSDDGGCVVWLAHLLYSYELCNETDHPGKHILDMLIPDKKDKLGAEQCTMFHARTAAEEREELRATAQREKYAQAMAEMRR